MGPLTNGRFMAYKCGLLATYKSWDDPPKRGDNIDGCEDQGS